jgi:hypothetical protein
LNSALYFSEVISGCDYIIVTDIGGLSGIREKCCGTREIGLNSSVISNTGVPGLIPGPGTTFLFFSKSTVLDSIGSFLAFIVDRNRYSQVISGLDHWIVTIAFAYLICYIISAGLMCSSAELLSFSTEFIIWTIKFMCSTIQMKMQYKYTHHSIKVSINSK